jgi:TolB-like protein
MLVEMIAFWCVTLSLVTTWPAAFADDGTSPPAGTAPASDDGLEASTTESQPPVADPSPPADAPSVVEAAPATAEPETILAAVLDLLARAASPARIAVLPVKDDDSERAARLGAAIARALTAERLEVVTEKTEKNVDDTAPEDTVPEDDSARAARLKVLAVDHVLIAEVRDEGGVRVLDMRLVSTADGQRVAQTSLPLTRVESDLSTTRQSVRGGIDAVTDGIARAMERLPGETRYQRLAVLPLQTNALADENKGLSRTVERELSRALIDRGFLVVERTRLDDVIAAREAAIDDDAIPELSRAVDAQAFVSGTMAPAGDKLLVTVRVISAIDGTILGTGSAEIPREGAIALSSDLLEVRTPSEALFRSAVAPGWGQFYNQEPVKGSLVAVAVFGLAAATVVIGGLGALTRLSYELATPFPGDDPAQLGQSLKARREAADVMLLTAVAGAFLTTVFWSGNVVDAYLTAGE